MDQDEQMLFVVGVLILVPTAVIGLVWLVLKAAELTGAILEWSSCRKAKRIPDELPGTTLLP